MDLVDRFINYVKIDTKSDDTSHVTPSTDKQFNLANLLVKELNELGVDDASVDKNCVVYGHIKGNSTKKLNHIGFIAHMDTSPEMSGTNCKPRIIEKYDGGTIVLNKELNITMDISSFPILKKDIGADLIVTDGTTLLGADDKAGVAIIMNLVDYIYNHPEFKHGDISIAFTPDEEIGEGADHFDIKRFNADYAYTVDGGEVNSVEYENFNAASADVTINGLSIHPGDAKDQMINAILVAMEFNALLPEKDRPVNTEGYEGFNHINSIEGDVSTVKMHYIIRNHDKAKLEKQKNDFLNAQEILNKKYKNNTVVVEIKDTYSNMAELIKPHMEIVDKAKAALKELGVEPISSPIRGGTDGARLTYDGLLCPNLGTGGRNYHGKYEYANINEMKIMAEVLIKLVSQ